ncbi:hypothetical protein HY358_00560 [Candidatus Roizmanbacteria bacterium]|nr:hypothetical protein [Candidatus Roizmanbacteria bacterium]
MNSVFAQSVNIGGQTIEGPLVKINTIADIINKTLTVIIPFAVVLLLIVFIWGGYDFLLARGNQDKVKSAKAKLTAGIIGFILLISSYLMVKLISAIFGIGDGVL